MPRAKPGPEQLAARAKALQYMADNLAGPPPSTELFSQSSNQEQAHMVELTRRRLRAQAECLWAESGRLHLGLPKR